MNALLSEAETGDGVEHRGMEDTIRVSRHDMKLLVRARVLPARQAPKVWDALILRSKLHAKAPRHAACDAAALAAAVGVRTTDTGGRGSGRGGGGGGGSGGGGSGGGGAGAAGDPSGVAGVMEGRRGGGYGHTSGGGFTFTLPPSPAWFARTMFHSMNLLAAAVYALGLCAYAVFLFLVWQSGWVVATASAALAVGMYVSATVFLSSPRSRLLGAAILLGPVALSPVVVLGVFKGVGVWRWNTTRAHRRLLRRAWALVGEASQALGDDVSAAGGDMVASHPMRVLLRACGGAVFRLLDDIATRNIPARGHVFLTLAFGAAIAVGAVAASVVSFPLHYASIFAAGACWVWRCVACRHDGCGGVCDVCCAGYTVLGVGCLPHVGHLCRLPSAHVCVPPCACVCVWCFVGVCLFVCARAFAVRRHTHTPVAGCPNAATSRRGSTARRCTPSPWLPPHCWFRPSVTCRRGVSASCLWPPAWPPVPSRPSWLTQCRGSPSCPR